MVFISCFKRTPGNRGEYLELEQKEKDDIEEYAENNRLSKRLFLVYETLIFLR